jgi:hypothetical protein
MEIDKYKILDIFIILANVSGENIDFSILYITEGLREYL